MSTYGMNFRQVHLQVDSVIVELSSFIKIFRYYLDVLAAQLTQTEMLGQFVAV